MNSIFSGIMTKLTGRVDAGTVTYFQDDTALNALVGKTITLSHNGQTVCQGCAVTNTPLSNDGHCPACAATKASCDICSIKPELCHYDAGTCREPQWGEANCFAPHTVYLSVTSGVKVGITRNKKLPQRWIDQGATQAIAILEVDNRLTAGLIEQILCTVMADKTNWRKMLTGETTLDLAAVATEITPQIEQALSLYGNVAKRVDGAETVLAYPVTQYPAKVGNPANFDKTPTITGTLLGIKGQYLILDTGVFNWRKHIGYHIELSVQ